MDPALAQPAIAFLEQEKLSAIRVWAKETQQHLQKHELNMSGWNHLGGHETGVKGSGLLEEDNPNPRSILAQKYLRSFVIHPVSNGFHGESEAEVELEKDIDADRERIKVLTAKVTELEREKEDLKRTLRHHLIWAQVKVEGPLNVVDVWDTAETLTQAPLHGADRHINYETEDDTEDGTASQHTMPFDKNAWQTREKERSEAAESFKRFTQAHNIDTQALTDRANIDKRAISPHDLSARRSAGSVHAHKHAQSASWSSFNDPSSNDDALQPMGTEHATKQDREIQAMAAGLNVTKRNPMSMPATRISASKKATAPTMDHADLTFPVPPEELRRRLHALYATTARDLEPMTIEDNNRHAPKPVLPHQRCLDPTPKKTETVISTPIEHLAGLDRFIEEQMNIGASPQQHIFATVLPPHKIIDADTPPNEPAIPSVSGPAVVTTAGEESPARPASPAKDLVSFSNTAGVSLQTSEQSENAILPKPSLAVSSPEKEFVRMMHAGIPGFPNKWASDQVPPLEGEPVEVGPVDSKTEARRKPTGTRVLGGGLDGKCYNWIVRPFETSGRDWVEEEGLGWMQAEWGGRKGFVLRG